MDLEKLINIDCSIEAKLIISQILFKYSKLNLDVFEPQHIAEAIVVIVTNSNTSVYVGPNRLTFYFFNPDYCSFESALSLLGSKLEVSQFDNNKFSIYNNCLNLNFVLNYKSIYGYIYISIVNKIIYINNYKSGLYRRLALSKFNKNNNLESELKSKPNNINAIDINKNIPRQVVKLLKNNNLAGLTKGELFIEVEANSPLQEKISFLSSLFDLKDTLSSLNGSIIKLKLPLGSDGTLLKDKKEKDRINRVKKSSSAEIVVDFLKDQLVKYNNSINAKTFFPNEWRRNNLITARSMLKTLSEEEIKGAIIWFYNNSYWKDKIDGLQMVSRHYQKYLSGNKSQTKGTSFSSILNRNGGIVVSNQ